MILYPELLSQRNRKPENCPDLKLYVLLMLIYLGFGLAVTTMCIDLVGIQYIQKIHYFGRKFRGADILQLLKRKHMIEHGLTVDQSDELLKLYLSQFQEAGPIEESKWHLCNNNSSEVPTDISDDNNNRGLEWYEQLLEEKGSEQSINKTNPNEIDAESPERIANENCRKLSLLIERFSVISASERLPNTKLIVAMRINFQHQILQFLRGHNNHRLCRNKNYGGYRQHPLCLCRAQAVTLVANGYLKLKPISSFMAHFSTIP
uniref:Ion_trans_2 domain-containing protein n=1 Tax=Elaeophora elaphi TaxID=1147741 RepID=A0A0R3S1V4_9BILA